MIGPVPLPPVPVLDALWRARYVAARPRLWWTADGRRAIRYGLRIRLHEPMSVRRVRAVRARQEAGRAAAR